MNISTMKIIEKDFYEEILKDDKEYTYLYHYIIVKYNENNKIKEIKIDNINDLKKSEDQDITCKYYIEKIHYFNESDNVICDEGEPAYIYNIGYFFMNSFYEQENKNIEILFKQYENNYKNLKFDFTDKEFLEKNMSRLYM